MSLHALDDIGDAIDATKAFLTPVSVRQWLKLAFVVLFIGGGGGGGGLNQLQSLSNVDEGDFGTAPDAAAQVTGTLDWVVDAALLQAGSGVPPEAQQAFAGAGVVAILLVAAFLLLAVVFAVLSNFMEFVFVQSLVDTEVHVRRYFSDNIGNGLRLFGFRLVLTVVSLVAAAAVLFTVLVGVLGVDLANPNTLDPATVFDALPLLLVPLVVGAVVFGLVRGFTNNFVVPLMLQGGHGVLAGWGRLWGSITDQPKQYVAYVVFSVVLNIGTGLVAAILGVLLFVVLLIPFGLLALVVWVAVGEGVAAAVLVGLVFAVYGLLVFVLGLLIRVPLRTFLRYYAMLVLGDVDGDLDPIPEVRKRIRPDDPDEGAAVAPSES